jgi:hypothetical protein
MAGAVGDEGDQPLARADCVGGKLVNQRADRAHHGDIRALAIGADIVAVADAAALGDREESARMILDKYIFAFAASMDLRSARATL